jgi:hypothetical protein
VRTLLQLSGVPTDFFDQTIGDFRGTFFQTLHTNTGYEGAYDEITPLNDTEVTYCGQTSVVPELEFEVERAGHLTLVVARMQSGDAFPTGRIQLMRLGVFLRRTEHGDHVPRLPRRLGWLYLTTARDVHSTFRSGLYTYISRTDHHVLAQRHLLERMDRSQLALQIDPLVDLGQQQNDPRWTDAYRGAASSDVWIVNWGPASVRIRSPRDVQAPASLKRTAWGLYPQLEPRADSALHDIHLQPALHILAYRAHAVTNVVPDPPDEVSDIVWDVTLPGVTLGRLLHELSVGSGLPALLLVVVLAFVTGDDRFYAVVAVIIVFALVVWRTGWQRRRDE